ncbi:MAG: hypothetical protein GDA50_06185 [Alphaproteobacteria bacterium GM202ARS2]|nr:hypothetical protein [Alphaproteobacteria bacterium GM202ARS2]
MLLYGALALVALAAVLLVLRLAVRAFMAYRDKTHSKARTWWIVAIGVLIGVLVWRGYVTAALSSLPALLAFFVRWLPLWEMARSFFLFRRGAGARGQQRTGAQSRMMSRDEALDVLGLRGVTPLTDVAINKAYKDLIRRVHPDSGGSSGLAARLNEARDVLLQQS